jgi:hypothetical protein
MNFQVLTPAAPPGADIENEELQNSKPFWWLGTEGRDTIGLGKLTLTILQSNFRSLLFALHNLVTLGLERLRDVVRM